jgi:hypothetical protein
MSKTKLLLTIAMFGVAIFAFGAKAHAEECNNHSIPIIDLMESRTEPKVEQLRSVALTYLFPIVVFLAILATYFEYLRGKMDLKSLGLRCALVFFLLYSYTGDNNFRDVIKTSSIRLGETLRGNNNGIEAMFESLYRMFKAMQLTMESNDVNDSAVSVFSAVFSPGRMLFVFFVLTSVIVGVLAYLLEVGTSIFLLALDIIGPLILPFGVLRSGQEIAKGWCFRYCEVAFYRVIYSCFMIAISTSYELLANAFKMSNLLQQDPIVTWQCMFTACLLSVVIGVVSIFMLAKIPAMSASIVSGFGIGIQTNPLK